jgi:hypothetical protein
MKGRERDRETVEEIRMGDASTDLQRREFLRDSAVAVGAVLLCSCSPPSSRRSESSGEAVEDYYTSRRTELLGDFDELREHTDKILIASHGEEFADAIDAEARQEFESLIPEIPYIGGDDNELTDELIQATMALALYRAMKKQGKTVEEIGEVLYRTVEAMASSYPRILTRAIGFYQMSGLGQRPMRRAALESQQRVYPEGWVFHFVEGDGEEFDWGIDFTECGIVKFFRTQGAAELAPYMCLADYPISEALGTGLIRKTTIAGGAERCDFRFKRGRETRRSRGAAVRTAPEEIG